MDDMYEYFPAYFNIICLQKVENWSLECVKNGNFAVDASVDPQKHTLSHRFLIKCIQMHAWASFIIIWSIYMYTSQHISLLFAFKKLRIGHLNVSKTETLPWMHPWIPKNIPLVIDFQSKMHANACLSQVYNYMDHMYVYFPAYFIIICLQKV